MPGSWHQLDSKEAVEDHLIEKTWSSSRMEVPLHLGRTGKSPMADAIHAGTLEQPALSDKAIFSILTQLKQHPLLHELINPIVTAEDFRSSFQRVSDKTASSSSGRHVGHYKACIDPNDEHTVLLAEVFASLMKIPLATVYCPERWSQAVDVMLEKIPGISKTNKL
jgi:hypothetical protein